MPEVNVDQDIGAPIERVWEVVLDIENYAEAMDNVRWVRMVESDGKGVRRTAWSVLLKGSILEWEEEERLDHDAHKVVFKQLQGDLEFFDGHWTLEEIGPSETRAHFEVEFEIGIPMLADMLNPVAKRALEETGLEILHGFEQFTSGD